MSEEDKELKKIFEIARCKGKETIKYIDKQLKSMQMDVRL